MQLSKYVCFHCSYRFELQLLPDDDTEEVPCPRCGCAAIPRKPVLDMKGTSPSLQKKRKDFVKKVQKAVHKKAREPKLDFDIWLESIKREKRKD